MVTGGGGCWGVGGRFRSAGFWSGGASACIGTIGRSSGGLLLWYDTRRTCPRNNILGMIYVEAVGIGGRGLRKRLVRWWGGKRRVRGFEVGFARQIFTNIINNKDSASMPLILLAEARESLLWYKVGGQLRSADLLQVPSPTKIQHQCHRQKFEKPAVAKITGIIYVEAVLEVGVGGEE